VIDPSLSVQYTTFLGGAGEDVANSIALDATGKVYIGGTTTSASTFDLNPHHHRLSLRRHPHHHRYPNRPVADNLQPVF
jgi:hypothetical protein